MIVHHQIGAGYGEALGDGAADTFRGAGDDGDFAVEHWRRGIVRDGALVHEHSPNQPFSPAVATVSTK
jgi:hypothetical protein